jgi:hypothetical protein
VLLLAPLAVSHQHEREANKFGIPARVVNAQSDGVIEVTNYQKIDRFALGELGGVALDESSILKSTDGKYRTKLIEDCANVPFRLAATATPAPNDFMELGNHAEFLGVMSYTDMLATFFVHDGGDTQKWRLKGHAEDEFWKWMASWSVMLRKPSDLGYDDAGYDLPPMKREQHVVAAEYAPSMETGLLFPMEARTMQERISARRDTVGERVELAKQIVIGSFGDKLAAWYGNQNTPSVGASAQNQTLNIGQSVTSSPPAISSDDPNTCANTAPKTSTSGSERQSSKKRSTPAAASDTQQTLNIASEPKPTQESEHQSNAESNCSAQNTGSLLPSTTIYCGSKTGAAPSADEGITESGSTSITATKQGMSEDFSARHAIPASATSKTIPTGSPAPSNTSVRLEPWVVWCHLNSEQEALERAFGPLAISIHGGMSDEEKLVRHDAWIRGEAPIIIVKPSMFGHGLNWQHCCNMVFVGLNDSFEQIYQAERRCWRFGQKRQVNVHFIASETEGAVVANLRRKESDAERMAAAMVMHMADLSSQTVRGMVRDRPDYNPTQPMRLPAFLRAA